MRKFTAPKNPCGNYPKTISLKALTHIASFTFLSLIVIFTFFRDRTDVAIAILTRYHYLI